MNNAELWFDAVQTIRVAGIPKFKALDRWPGDQAVRLLHAAQDVDGKWWRKGSVFGCVLCGGAANGHWLMHARRVPTYCTVTTGVGRATFREHEYADG